MQLYRGGCPAVTDGLDGFREARILLRRVRGGHSHFHVIRHYPARLDMSLRPGPACYRLVVTASLLQTPVVAGLYFLVVS